MDQQAKIENNDPINDFDEKMILAKRQARKEKKRAKIIVNATSLLTITEYKKGYRNYSTYIMIHYKHTGVTIKSVVKSTRSVIKRFTTPRGEFHVQTCHDLKPLVYTEYQANHAPIECRILKSLKGLNVLSFDVRINRPAIENDSNKGTP